MPSTTSRYRFEFRLRDWAAGFSSTLCGRPTAFFVGLRDDGSIRRVYFASPDAPFDAAAKASLAQGYPRWFLFLPDDDERAYLEWLGLPRETVERWIGRRLEAADFLDVRSTGARDAWPEAWRVIVG